MEVHFTKMHGAGNDFLMIHDIDGSLRLSGDSIRRLCSRHRGIGADGLITIGPSETADFAMRYFNADGGEADLCGNGARCAAAFARDLGVTGRAMAFDSRAGRVSAEILDDGVQVGIADVRGMRLDMRIASAEVHVHYGICGVPHAVIIDEDVGRWSHDEFVRFARAVRGDPGFGPAGANVNIVTVSGGNRCSYRTYERGVEDETLACGTGAVVITTVLAHLGLAGVPVRCETHGKDILEVDVTKTPDGAAHCRLKGPAAVSFRGTFRTEDYERL